MVSVSKAVSSFVDELTGLLEPLAGRRRRRPGLALVERGGDFECYRLGRRMKLVAKGSLESLGKKRLPRDMTSKPVEVRLDGSRILTKILRLPAASRNYLDPIVRHQLDRATPWSADRVVFDYSIAEDEPAQGDQIAIRLVATSREVFDSAMQRIAAARIKPAVVGTSEDPLDRPSPINLLRSDRLQRRQALRRKVAASVLAIILVGGGLSAMAGWQLQAANAEAAALGRDMDAARAAIEAARAGRQLSEDRDRLLSQKRNEVPIVLLLERLSSVVPTSTHLTELAVAEDEVRLTGLSDDAPALIGILENADILSEVRFAAPTTRVEGATQDRFEIVARLVPAAPTATD